MIVDWSVHVRPVSEISVAQEPRPAARSAHVRVLSDEVVRFSPSADASDEGALSWKRK
jgi:hypothetical protein